MLFFDITCENIEYVDISNAVYELDIGKQVNLDNNFNRKIGESAILDRQSFPALRITPFPKSNIGINVFSSGKIIFYGVKTIESVELCKKFIENNII